MYVLTKTQKNLLKMLNTVIIKTYKEAEKDDLFNEFLAGLGIFEIDLLEISDILIDNYSEIKF